MSKKLINKLGKIAKKDLGERINDNEEKIVIRRLDELLITEKTCDDLRDINLRQKDRIIQLTDKLVDAKKAKEDAEEISKKNYEAVGIIKRIQEALKLIINYK